MGFNTTVLVLNDALSYIERDVNFGKNLVETIHYQSVNSSPKDVSSLNHCNAATVIETHHADILVPVAIGGNSGRVLKGTSFYSASDEMLLRQMADSMGFELHKKRVRR